MIAAGTLLLGIDGGGTGCRAALCRDDGRIVGQGTAGPANMTSDFEGGVANIRAALIAAARAAGITDAELRRAVCHAGLAGVQSDAAADRVAAALPVDRCRVTEDRDIAIAGALGAEGDGAVLAIGTGSFIGLRRHGAIHAVGGWGLQLSDQASGAWIGRSALAATLEAVDGLRPRSELAEALLKRFGGAPQDLVAFAATARPVDYGALAPMVMAAAESGDTMARDLVADGAAWLERALVALGHLPFEPICLTGGLGRFYRAALDRTGRRFVDPIGSPLDGALILARAAAETGP